MGLSISSILYLRNFEIDFVILKLSALLHNIVFMFEPLICWAYFFGMLSSLLNQRPIVTYEMLRIGKRLKEKEYIYFVNLRL